MRLRMARPQPEIAAVEERRTRIQSGAHGHLLGAAGDHQILGAGHDLRGRHIDGRDARAAEPVERDARGAHVIAGIERRHAPPGLRPAADGCWLPDDIVDVAGLEIVSLGDRAQHGRAELLRMDIRQGALAGPADSTRRSACINDKCVHDRCPIDWLLARGHTDRAVKPDVFAVEIAVGDHRISCAYSSGRPSRRGNWAPSAALHFSGAREQRRVENSRQDRIHADGLVRQIARDRQRHSDDTGFGRRVGDLADLAVLGGNGRRGRRRPAIAVFAPAASTVPAALLVIQRKVPTRLT